jgi:hypothetical protein
MARRAAVVLFVLSFTAPGAYAQQSATTIRDSIANMRFNDEPPARAVRPVRAWPSRVAPTRTPRLSLLWPYLACTVAVSSPIASLCHATAATRKRSSREVGSSARSPVRSRESS